MPQANQQTNEPRPCHKGSRRAFIKHKVQLPMLRAASKCDDNIIAHFEEGRAVLAVEDDNSHISLFINPYIEDNVASFISQKNPLRLSVFPDRVEVEQALGTKVSYKLKVVQQYGQIRYQDGAAVLS